MERITPGSGQESVWDYPRPPRAEACSKRIQIVFAEQAIAETIRSIRVLETSHPPVYYIPSEDFLPDVLVATSRQTFCEWKGVAQYCHVQLNGRVAENAAWRYCQPTPAFAALRDHVAVYAQRMDACLVDGERAQPQPGEFYGGWITQDIVGPFKGMPGTNHW